MEWHAEQCSLWLLLSKGWLHTFAASTCWCVTLNAKGWLTCSTASKSILFSHVLFTSHHSCRYFVLLFFSHRTFRWSESACRVKVPQQDRVRILGEAFGVGLRRVRMVRPSAWVALFASKMAPGRAIELLPEYRPQLAQIFCLQRKQMMYLIWMIMVLLSWMVWSCMCLPGCSIRTSESSWPSFLFPQSISGTPCSRDWQLVAKYVLGRIDDFIEKLQACTVMCKKWSLLRFSFVGRWWVDLRKNARSKSETCWMQKGGWKPLRLEMQSALFFHEALDVSKNSRHCERQSFPCIPAERMLSIKRMTAR